MERRQFLKLGVVTGGVFALGGAMRPGGRSAFAQSTATPIVDRLVLTNVVDNIYDVFAKGGTLDTITVERMRGSIGVASPAAEHGLAYHLESAGGGEHGGVAGRATARRRARARVPPGIGARERAARDPARLRAHRAQSLQQLRGAEARPVAGRRARHQPRPRRSLRRIA